MSKPDIQTATAIVNFLNSLLPAEAETLDALIRTRVPCGIAMRDHPSIQVSAEFDGSNPQVGVLGILNGICGAFESDGHGPVLAVYDAKDKLIGFYLRTE